MLLSHLFCLSLSKLYYCETKSGTQWEIWKENFIEVAFVLQVLQGNAEFGHFNLLLLFSRGQQGNVPAQPL